MHFQLKNLSPHNLVFPSRPKMMNPMHKLKDVFLIIPNSSEIKRIPAFFCQESGKDWSHQNLLAQVISSNPRGKPFRSSPCNTKKTKFLARYPKTCWQTACFWHFPGNHTCSIRNRRLSFSHLYCWCFPVVPVAHGTRIMIIVSYQGYHGHPFLELGFLLPNLPLFHDAVRPFVFGPQPLPSVFLGELCRKWIKHWTVFER